MKPLVSLVRSADAGDSLAPVVAALLDSGLIVTTRDGAGRYVQLSEAYGRELGLDDVGLSGRGDTFTEGYHFFDANGRELPLTEHPSYLVRLTGAPQRLHVSGVRAPTGREAWMINSYMPLDRDEDGWQVLTVGVPLPRSIFHPPTGEDDAGPFQRALLDFALRAAGARWTEQQMVEELRPPVMAIADAPLSVSFMVIRDGLVHLSPIVRRTEAPLPPPMRLSDEAAVRWQMSETFYNPAVSDADVIGDRVVVELAHTIRSFALIPVKDGTGRRVASLSVTAPTPHALSPQQRRALEHLAHLAGPALVEAPRCG